MNTIITVVMSLHEERSDDVFVISQLVASLLVYAIYTTNTLASLTVPRYARRSRLDYNMTESIHSCVQVYGCFFLCVPTHLAHLQDAPVRTLNRLFLRSLGALKR